MTETTRELALSANRAEEMGYDVWDKFVLPSFYDATDLKHLKKPRVIVGGRGCGKTMLLRYLSHETAFSPKRRAIANDEIDHIGLYWRMDTQFATLLTARGLPDDVWSSAFQHLGALVVGAELLRACGTISRSCFNGLQEDELDEVDLSRLVAFDRSLGGSLSHVLQTLEAKVWEFQTWAGNVRQEAPPRFIPTVPFVKALASELGRQLPALAQANYFVYIDEYENLLKYQQRMVNTWLKHSEPPLIFNVATKRNGMETRATVGSESITDIHDYRTYDIEALEQHFDVFAAEVLFMRLYGAQAEQPFSMERLRDPSAVGVRRQRGYMEKVRSAAAALFPQLSEEEIAAAALKDEKLNRRLLERASRSLARRRSVLSATEFIDDAHPAASVIAPALLSRRGLAPTDVRDEMVKLRRDQPNRFFGATGWVHNNLFGALLQLYDPMGRPCPLYAGFGRFVSMSHNNIRHFLELCHKAIERDAAEGAEGIAVPIQAQAEAARLASAAFVAEVRSFGPKGNALHAFTMRLGSLFSLAHQRPSLSEPEQNHFAVLRGRADVGEEVTALLREAVKWSILFEEPGTKKKSASDPEALEYVLNPIYAPYFHISYRKKRRLELSSDELNTIAAGSYDGMRELTTQLAKRWAIEGAEAPVGPLFAQLHGSVE